MDPYMAEAVKEARAGIKNGDGGPFGAVIVRQGKIVARGHNRVVGTNDPTAHAEICAIREASAVLGRFDLSDCVIYTTCEPCPMCYAAIHWARISQIYRGCSRHDAAAIGFDDNYIYDDIRGELREKRVVSEEVDRRSCLEVFGEWNTDPGRVRY